MLDAKGAGASHSGTNWAAMSVLDMWLAVGNQDTTAHWQLLTGWRRSYELTLQHLTQVKHYRDSLAAVWPPDRSPASAAYLGRLDVLIGHLQETYDAAVTNHRAFNGATLALSSARAELAKVVDEYLANEGRLAAFDREQAERSSRGLQRGPERPRPVADGRQAELEAQARKIMYALSTELAQATTQITKPSAYSPDFIRGDHRDVSPYRAPAIPPIVPFAPQPHSEPEPADVYTQAPSPPLSRTESPAQSPGLVLGGAGPSAPIPPAPSPTTISPVLGNSAPPITDLPAPAPAWAASKVRSPTQTSGGSSPIGRYTARAGAGASYGSEPHALPPGGVIGSTSRGALGQPTPTSRPAQANSANGVISPGSIPSRSTNSDRKLPTSKQVEGDINPFRWDPDDPWATAEGVPPVVLPRGEQRIVPGPAIGLH